MLGITEKIHVCRNLKVDQFIQLDAVKVEKSHFTTKGKGEDVEALSMSERLSLQRGAVSPMISPVASKKTDSLKKAMKELVDAESKLSFIIDEGGRVEGLITLNDIMVQFAPPCMDSRINGGGFFKSALQQTGCDIKGGTIVCDQKL